MRGFLLFSGYNVRAVIALCRLFRQTGCRFFVIASGPEDPLLKTTYRDQVVHMRQSSQLSLSEIGDVTAQLRQREQLTELVFCPTSEFLNQFMLDHQDEWPSGLVWVGLQKDLYYQLTSKWLLGTALAGSGIVQMPPPVDLDRPQFPMVLKPRINVSKGKTLYPIFVSSQNEWSDLEQTIDRSSYFAQTYVGGQSHYLCFYFADNGRYEGYGQINLIQQPGGKSIVLAQKSDLSAYPLAVPLAEYLISQGYRGPIMIELMEHEGRYYFIEANPRFWGPLQLGFSANPNFFSLYLEDSLGQAYEVASDERQYYAWHQGYRSSQEACRIYPAAANLRSVDIARIMEQSDLFQQADSRELADL